MEAVLRDLVPTTIIKKQHPQPCYWNEKGQKLSSLLFFFFFKCAFYNDKRKKAKINIGFLLFTQSFMQSSLNSSISLFTFHFCAPVIPYPAAFWRNNKVFDDFICICNHIPRQGIGFDSKKLSRLLKHLERILIYSFCFRVFMFASCVYLREQWHIGQQGQCYLFIQLFCTVIGIAGHWNWISAHLVVSNKWADACEKRLLRVLTGQQVDY